MLTHDRIHIWAWDARPFPAFPALKDVWADGPAWRAGRVEDADVHGWARSGDPWWGRTALVATVALSVGCAPIGCVLLLRRMSLVGDALAHAVLPGAAAGFLLAGLSLPAMSAGGFVAALAVARA